MRRRKHKLLVESQQLIETNQNFAQSTSLSKSVKKREINASKKKNVTATSKKIIKKSKKGAKLSTRKRIAPKKRKAGKNKPKNGKKAIKSAKASQINAENVVHTPGATLSAKENLNATFHGGVDTGRAVNRCEVAY